MSVMFYCCAKTHYKSRHLIRFHLTSRWPHPSKHNLKFPLKGRLLIPVCRSWPCPWPRQAHPLPRSSQCPREERWRESVREREKEREDRRPLQMDSGEALKFQSGSRVCKNDIPWKKEKRERTTRYDKECVHAHVSAEGETRGRDLWLHWHELSSPRLCAGSPHGRLTRPGSR